MAQSSPLFSGSLQLLAHAIEHSLSKDELDRRFVVLHLATAVELLLKDRMLDLDISIYREPRQGKGFYTLVEDLESAGVPIPQKALLEVLLEERDSVQNHFGSPTEPMVKLCVENVMRFFEEFLVQGGVASPLREHLSGLVREEQLRQVYPDKGMAPLFEVKEVAKQQPTSAFLIAWGEMEKKIKRLKEIAPVEKTGLDGTLSEISWLLRFIRDNKLNLDFPTSLWSELADLTLVRGSVVHDKMVLDRASGGRLVRKVEQLVKDLDLLLEKVEESSEAG